MSLFLGFLLIFFKAQEDAQMSSKPGDISWFPRNSCFFYVFYFIFCLCWVFLVLWAFLSSCLSRGCCVGAVLGGLSWRCLLPLQVRCSAASRGGVFSCCRAQAVGMGRHWLRLSDSRAQVQQSWYTCLAVPQPVGTSQTRDQTHIACMTKWILNHWPTREAPMC